MAAPPLTRLNSWTSRRTPGVSPSVLVIGSASVGAAEPAGHSSEQIVGSTTRTRFMIMASRDRRLTIRRERVRGQYHSVSLDIGAREHRRGAGRGGVEE